ncbi:putative DNA repair protein Nse1, partial [Peziza echinospora]
MVYGDANRAFIQAFFAHRVLTYAEAEPIVSAILAAHTPAAPLPCTPGLFQTYLAAANTALLPYDFEIRQTPSQTVPRTTHYILTNTTSDPLIQLATTHTADEIAFLRRLLDVIFDTGNTRQQEVYAISSLEALRLHKNLPGEIAAQTQGGGASGGVGLSMKEADLALGKFCEEGWLARTRGGGGGRSSKTGNYVLSIRGLTELKQYLIDTYNTGEKNANEDGGGAGSASPDADAQKRVRFCFGCKDIITIGQRCDDLDCGVRFHDACKEGYFATQGRRRGGAAAAAGDVCPECSVAWTGETFVGERAETGRQRRNVTSGGARRGGAAKVSVAKQLRANGKG